VFSLLLLSSVISRFLFIQLRLLVVVFEFSTGDDDDDDDDSDSVNLVTGANATLTRTNLITNSHINKIKKTARILREKNGIYYLCSPLWLMNAIWQYT
jgi:hypothetical protein